MVQNFEKINLILVSPIYDFLRFFELVLVSTWNEGSLARHNICGFKRRPLCQCSDITLLLEAQKRKPLKYGGHPDYVYPIKMVGQTVTEP